MKLRPLIVVTGALKVEGGRIKREGRWESSEDRKAATVTSTGFMRRLGRLRILKCPFGHILDRENLPEVKRLLLQAAEEVAKFHRSPRDCQMTNCMIWETLQGNRLAAFEVWLSANRGDPDVEAALPALQAEAA